MTFRKPVVVGLYVFSPNDAQKLKCEEITTTTYNYICTILAGSSNIHAAIYQIRPEGSGVLQGRG